VKQRLLCALGRDVLLPVQDLVYRSAKDAGIAAHHCVQGSPAFVHGGVTAQQPWKALNETQLATPGATQDATQVSRACSQCPLGVHLLNRLTQPATVPSPLLRAVLLHGRPRLPADSPLRQAGLAYERNQARRVAASTHFRHERAGLGGGAQRARQPVEQ